MYARIQRFNLSQGMQEIAEQLAGRTDEIVGGHRGFHSLTLFADESSGEYIFLTLWASLEDIAAFERSPDEWRARDLMSPHLTTVPQIEVYQIHNVPAAADGGEVDTTALKEPTEPTVPTRGSLT
jgi:heme-degrading monooxygenase HmoA